MATHARYSPSKLEALESCPCFEMDDEAFGKTKEGEETPAERGTRLHKAVETRDLSLCNDDDETAQVQSCIDGEEVLISSHGGPERTKVLRERRVTVPDLTFGTLDFVMLYGDQLQYAYVRDLKFVRSDSVSAPEVNFQLACYVCGLFHDTELAGIKEIKADLFMPTLRWCPPSVTYTRADVPALIARIENTLNKVNDVFKAPVTCGECVRCANKTRCPALNTLATTVGRSIGLPLPEVFAADAPRTVKQRSMVMVLAKTMESWAETVIKFQNQWGKENRGELLPGFKWMTRAGNPAITDVKAASELVNIPLPDFLKACRVSITALAKAYKEVHGVSEKAARAAVDEALASVIIRGADVEYWQRVKDSSDRELLAP
jgi:hypothetical protein